VNTLRRKGLDQFLTKPLEDFLPNPRDYDDRDRKERRDFKADTEEVRVKYRQAYSTMRAIVKPNSACEAIIRDADLDCDVMLFFKLFSDQYLKTTSVSAAFNLILMFDKQPDETGDVIQAYIKLREIIYQMELVKEEKDGNTSDATTTPAGRRSTFLSSHSSTLTAPSDIATPRRDAVQTAFPEWIWIFTILKKLKETNKFHKLITNFLKTKIFNNTRMTIGRIKDAKIFELLKDFVRQQELENAEEEQKAQDKRSASIYHMDPTLYDRAMEDTEQFFRAHSTKFATTGKEATVLLGTRPQFFSHLGDVQGAASL
jgi:hypothetical protein